MNIGMLWYDNDPRTALTAKVARAADYFRQKYGFVADVCMVHPSMLGMSAPDLIEGQVMNVVVRPNRLIQPGHLWIGRDEMG